MEQGRGGPSLREAGEHVKSDFAELGRAAEREREALLARLRGFVEEHPLQAVGAAAGLGYALSGALVSRTTWKLLALGGRFYLGRLLEERVGATGNLGAPAPRAG